MILFPNKFFTKGGNINMKRSIIFVLFVLSLVLITGIAFAEDVVKIGVIFPMTGPFAAYGQMANESLKIANELRPQVLGKPVKLILLDNKSDKVEAANTASRLVEKEHVVAVIGPLTSSLSMSAAPILEKAKIPMMSPYATNPLVTQGKKFIFRACFIDPFQGKVAAKFAIDYLKIKRAALLTDISQDYCVGLVNFFEKNFKALGGEIVSKTFCKTGDQDFSAQLTAIKSKNPDLIYMPNYYAEDALIAKQAKVMGINAALLSGDAADAPEILDVGGDAVNGLYFTTHFDENAVQSELGRKYLEVYHKKFNKAANTVGALTFDAYYMVLDAIERAGSLDTVKIRDALSQTKGFEGVTGTITIDKNGNAVKPAVIKKIEDGKFKFVTIVNP